MTTMYTFLMVSEDGKSWEKLCDIKSSPDIMGAPEMLDKTTLTDSERHYEPGIKASDAWEFPANYDPETFVKLHGYEGQRKHYAVWYGGEKSISSSVVTPTGADGKFETEGYLSVTPAAGEVNAIREMTITIAKDADVAFSLPED